MENLRQPTIPSRIIDITKGKFIQQEGMQPSYIITKLNQKIARAKIVGTVTDKFLRDDNNYSVLTIDDSTDSLRIKAFREDVSKLENIEIGDSVMIIGKVREYNNENYIIPEIIKKLENPNYESLHKLETLKFILEQKKITELIEKNKDNFTDLEELKKFLSKKYNISGETTEAIVSSLDEKQQKKEKDYKPVVIKKIEELDTGDGVEVKILFDACNIKEETFEEVINELLSDGICFEPKPGILKVV